MPTLSRIVLVCILSILSCGPVAAETAVTKDVVARVGAIPVTIYEFNRHLQKIYPLQVSFHGKVSPEKLAGIKKLALDEMIAQAYKVQYALDEEISVANDAVDAEIDKVRGRFKSEDEFEKALGQEGLVAFRATVYRQLLAKQAEKVAVDDKVQVTEQQVREYYEANKQRFMRPLQYQASHILIKVDPALTDAEKLALKEKAEKLAKQAKAGEDFYNLAYYNSDDRTKYVGGDLGLFHEGQTVQEFDEALKTMAPGDIVGPVKSLYGYHIIKLVQRNEPRQLEYDEMSGKIRSQLEQQQRDALRDEWMAALKAKYPVEVFSPQ